MKKGLKIGGRIAGKVGKAALKIGGKVGLKALKLSGKAAIKTAKYTKKEAKILYAKYSALNKNSKRKLRNGLLIAGGALVIGGTIYKSKCTSDFSLGSHQENHISNDSLYKALTKTYKITDEASFRQLFDDALPLIHAALIPIEIYKEKGYYDGGDGKKKKSNTIGTGLWWFPIDGNPNNPRWVHTSYYLDRHPDTKVSFKESLTYGKAWFTVRDREQDEHKAGKKGKKVTNTVYNNMYKALKGSEINLHQFTAAASCAVNSESSGFDFCKYYAKNYKYPVSCAFYLAGLKPKDSSYDRGILKRHVAEACLFLYPEYAASLYSFKLKQTQNGNVITSYNQTTPEQCEKVLEDLKCGSTKLLAQHRDRIIKYVCKGGYTVADMANMLKSEKDRAEFLRYYIGETTSVFENTLADKEYEKALKEYHNGNYEAAMRGFQKIRSQGYDGADLRNDIAITYYNLGRYQECIEECKAVLNTGETHLHPAANFNAGKAYEALGNYERALKNYSRSLQVAEKLGVRDTLKINTYKNAIKRMQNTIDSLNPKPKVSQPMKQAGADKAKNKPAAKPNSKPKSNVKASTRKTPAKGKAAGKANSKPKGKTGATSKKPQVRGGKSRGGR